MPKKVRGRIDIFPKSRYLASISRLRAGVLRLLEVLFQMAGLILCGVAWRVFRPAGLQAVETRKVLTSLVYYLLLPALVLSVLWSTDLGEQSLIIAVAAFNIISMLVMVVTDKQSDIAILRTLGASPRTIMVIFVIQGAVIGILGTLMGVAGGVALALNVETLVPAIEEFFNVQFLATDVYYISKLPSDLHWEDVGLISVSAFVLTLLATLYPAWKAARIQPAEALRYE